MYRDFLWFFGMIAIIYLAGALMIKAYSSYECSQYGKVAGLETRHIGVETCMINDPEYGWMSYAERKAARFAERHGDK